MNDNHSNLIPQVLSEWSNPPLPSIGSGGGWAQKATSLYLNHWCLVVFTRICMARHEYFTKEEWNSTSRVMWNVHLKKICHFVWKRHDKMSPCTDSKVNANFEWVASWSGCQWRTGTPKSKTPLVAHFCSQRPSHSGMAHPNGLARAERYHTLATIANRFWARTILHWAAYTWYWRTDMLDRHSHSFNNIIRKTWYVVFPKDIM